MLKWCNQTTRMASTWAKCRNGAYLLYMLLFLTACGNGNNTKAVATPKVYTVEIKDMKFVPESITVAKGDEVVFINKDMVAHCVTEAAGKSWTSGNLPAGSTYSLIAKESSDYFCAIHVVMKGKIIVK